MSLIEIASLTLSKGESFNWNTQSRPSKTHSTNQKSHRTIVGVKCKDGVVLGAEKLMFSKLLVSGTHRRIYNVDHAIGMAICGKIPDGRHIMNYARNESNKFQKEFDIDIDGRTLSERLALYLNAYTLASSVRPFGST